MRNKSLEFYPKVALGNFLVSIDITVSCSGARVSYG